MFYENKISMKSIGAQPKTGQEFAEGPAAHIYGSARNYLVGISTYGEFMKFRGEFEAVNLATGESYRSANLLLPDIAASLLISALHAAGAKHGTVKTANEAENPGEPATAPVEFAIEIGIRKSKNVQPGGAGYEFTLRPLIETRDSDPIAALRKLVKDQAVAIHVPDKNSLPAPRKHVTDKKSLPAPAAAPAKTRR